MTHEKAIKFLKDKLFSNEDGTLTIKGMRSLRTSDVEQVIMKLEMEAKGFDHELWGDEEQELYDKMIK